MRTRYSSRSTSATVARSMLSTPTSSTRSRSGSKVSGVTSSSLSSLIMIAAILRIIWSSSIAVAISSPPLVLGLHALDDQRPAADHGLLPGEPEGVRPSAAGVRLGRHLQPVAGQDHLL